MRKILLKTALVAMVAVSGLMSVGAAEAPQKARQESIPLCGVVEGFYGTPWSVEDRLSLMKFMQEKGMNIYIYAPKDDPYHREKWREPYPKAERERLRSLIQAAQENHIEFVYALSPGLDIRLGDFQRGAEVEHILRKFSALYGMGVRRFAIFFDDIENKDGAAQAEVLNEVERRLMQEMEDVKPLITVPTEYFTEDMVKQENVAPYTKAFASHLDGDILVMYTGPGVVCEGITAEDIALVSQIYQRKMAVWWNYPVNDYQKEKLALGPVYGLTAEAGNQMAAILFNPMEFARLSRIALATGADYAAAPEKYDAEKSWDRAIKAQYGGKADAVRVFAGHSQRMENNWAHAGRPDAPEVRQHMDEFWQKVERGEDSGAEEKMLERDFAAMGRAAAKLSKSLPQGVKAECQPQVELLARLAEADRLALHLVQAERQRKFVEARAVYARLAEERESIYNQQTARLSNKTAMAFLDEAIAWYKSRN